MNTTDTEALPPLPEKWCLFCDKAGHQSDECQSTHAIATPQMRELFRLTHAALAQRQQVPEGWQLVPKVPTPQMERAAFDELELLGTPTENGTSMRNRVYRAMLAAAPALTAASPAQLQTHPAREAYIALLKAHDWTFEFTDDQSVWRNGCLQLAELKRLQSLLDPTYSIWNEYAPKEFKR